MASQQPFICLRCRLKSIRPPHRLLFHTSSRLEVEPPQASSVAPKVKIDIKHIRQNVPVYEHNCVIRNYKAQAKYPSLVKSLFEEWNLQNQSARGLRTRNNLVIARIANPTSLHNYDSEDGRGLGKMSREQLLEEGRFLKAKIADIEQKESAIMSEIESLAAALPNLTSDETPHGHVPTVTEYILDHPHSDLSNRDRIWRSHVHIGSELGILDFAGAALTSGWGWYFLRKEAADLEDALIKYALSVAKKLGWQRISPPSLVYSHIAGACGFQPRDQNGESQIYHVQQTSDDVGRKPQLSLTGTAEIPLAGMKANSILEEGQVPMKCIGVSRCYRAEAGARGVDTKGLYRVHEFTKVELFAWTMPSVSAQYEVFDEILSIQTTILKSLGLHCRILEMPSTDLGASASRKRDVEAFFPSRTKDEGYGEVTSVSTCTDYQTRRLATRLDLRSQGGKVVFPFTVNGTAMAIPRVLAAILENGWDEDRKEVRIPEVLWPHMDGLKTIKK